MKILVIDDEINICEILDEFLTRQGHSVVTAKSGGLIQIRRLDQSAADGQFYPAASGLAAAVSAGDHVVCIAVGGTVIVLARYVTS